MSRQVSGSELVAFERCPVYHSNLYIHGRGRIGPPSESIELGKWAHEVLASMMKGIAPNSPEVMNQPWWATDAKARALKLALLAWWDRYSAHTPWDQPVIQVERALSVQMDTFTLVGIPDAIVRFQGALWHVQHKTLDQSRSVATYAQGVAASLHESIYAILIKKAFPSEPYGGTMLNVVRKLSEKGAKEDASRALHLEFIPIADAQLQRAIDDISWAVGHFGITWRNRSSCVSPWGLCAYYESCWQGISLNDDSIYESVNPRERYEERP